MSICPHSRWVAFVGTDSTKSKYAGWFYLNQETKITSMYSFSCLASVIAALTGGPFWDQMCWRPCSLFHRVRISWLWVILKVKRKKRTKIPNGFYWLIIRYLKSFNSEVTFSKTRIIKILGFIIVYTKGFQTVCKIKTIFIKNRSPYWTF